MTDEPIAVAVAPAWRELPIRFGTEIGVAVAMFLGIGLAGVVLHLFVHWLEGMGFPRFAVLALSGVEWGLFAVDLILFVVYTGKTSYHHLILFLKMEVR